MLPQRHYCDITGLEAPYTDPTTGLRYHDKSVYALIKGLVRVSLLILVRHTCRVDRVQVQLKSIYLVSVVLQSLSSANR